MSNELYHYGVKGMRWGVRRSIQNHREKIRKRRLDKETKKLVEDSKNVTAKAEPGKTLMVTGKYSQKLGRYVYLTSHLVDEYGDVKLSYINGPEGHHYVAAGKDYIDKIDLNQYFRKTNGVWEYGVYK